MANKQIAINQLEKLLGDNIATVPLFQKEDGSPADDSPIIEIKHKLIFR